MRASNLQELVYKGGQAGVTKATVTITFDNSDKKQSPVGYESFDEITVSRQVNGVLVTTKESHGLHVDIIKCALHQQSKIIVLGQTYSHKTPTHMLFYFDAKLSPFTCPTDHASAGPRRRQKFIQRMSDLCTKLDVLSPLDDLVLTDRSGL